MAKEIFSSDWQNVVYQGRNDVVFESRNKEYGAFVIRRDYGKFLGKALLISVSAVVFVVAVPIIINLINSRVQEVEMPKDTIVDLAPPPLDENEPPPPPPPLPPVMETIKFTPPEVTEEEIPEDEIPPPQEQLQETQVAEVSQEGDEDALVIAPTNEVVEDNIIYDLVAIQEQPGFPGGEGELQKFLASNIKYPAMERDNGIQGKVYISFIVDRDGSVTNAEIYKGLKGGPNCDKEALRVVKMLPKWNPGKQNGKAVRVRYFVPIVFRLG